MKKLLLLLAFLPIFFILETKAAVFCEDFSTTTCHTCPDVSEILKEIYDSNQYPFYYVTMVVDESNVAMERAEECNIYGYPTCIFDGGYRVIFGKKNMEEYINAINECIERNKPSLDLKLKTKWMGENNIWFNLSIRNKEEYTYEGWLKVYVVEPTSRWRDNNGKPFHFALLDYAINEHISIQSGKTIYFEEVWNKYDIQKDNIMLIAVLFNESGEEKFSDPPQNQHPFIAYFVDACVASTPPPDEPPILQFIRKPSNITGFRNASFEWNGTDDYGDVLFSYKLSGHEEWHEWGNIRNVSYYNLSDGEYEFILRGKDNVGQISQISWKFIVDTSPPKIVYTYPKDGAKNVPIHTTIEIKFSHDMDKKSIKIEIEPYVDYTIEWKGRKLIIYPLSLNYEQIYTVTIKNARRISGQSLKEYSFSFETSSKDTTPPSIIYIKPHNEELQDKIFIKFSEPMDTLLHNGIIIKPWIPYEYGWEENDTLLIINLRKYGAGNYNVTLTKYLTDKYGNGLQENISFSFYITKPRILYVNVKNGETLPKHFVIEIEFSHEMDKESVENNLSIEPNINLNYNLSWENNTLKIKVDFERGKKYFINISSAKDKRNLSMEKPFSIYFFIEKEIERRERKQPGFEIFILIIALIIAIQYKIFSIR